MVQQIVCVSVFGFLVNLYCGGKKQMEIKENDERKTHNQLEILDFVFRRSKL